MRKRRKNPFATYSVNDISILYGFHPNTVRRWVNYGGLRHYRKGRGNKILIHVGDLKDYLSRYYEP